MTIAISPHVAEVVGFKGELVYDTCGPTAPAQACRYDQARSARLARQDATARRPAKAYEDFKNSHGP